MRLEDFVLNTISIKLFDGVPITYWSSKTLITLN